MKIFELGADDIFFILFYTLFFYKKYGRAKALLATAIFLIPLLFLPRLFAYAPLVPYLLIVVPLFLVLYLAYSRA